MFKSTENTIDCLKSIYGDKYKYNEVIYTTDLVPIKLICPKHGEFFDSPLHLISSRKGCPKCWNNQSKGEIKIREILEEYGFNFEQEKNLPNLYYKLPLYFDFYLEDYNTAIEYNGPQHFMPIEFFGGDYTFGEQQKRDEVKREFCRINNINLIEISFTENIMDKLDELIFLKMNSDNLMG